MCAYVAKEGLSTNFQIGRERPSYDLDRVTDGGKMPPLLRWPPFITLLTPSHGSRCHGWLVQPCFLRLEG